MKLRQLQQIIILEKTRNFHRAAELLNISQPPLSVSVKKLENELGIKLFERNPRAITPTPEGNLIIAQAREIVKLSDDLVKFAEEAKVGMRGQLSLGFVSSATYDIIPHLVPEFRNRFPAVSLSLSESTSKNIIEQIVQGDLDVGLVPTPIFGVEGINITHLATERLVLGVPRGHPLENRTEVDLKELAGESFILWGKNAEPWMRTLLDSKLSSVDIIPTVAEEASQIHTIVALVESGLGLALLPAVLRRSGMGRVRLLDLTCRGEPINIGFGIVVKEGSINRLTTNFNEMTVKAFRDSNWHSSGPPSGI